jgi:hypothetical protein
MVQGDIRCFKEHLFGIRGHIAGEADADGQRSGGEVLCTGEFMPFNRLS